MQRSTRYTRVIYSSLVGFVSLGHVFFRQLNIMMMFNSVHNDVHMR